MRRLSLVLTLCLAGAGAAHARPGWAQDERPSIPAPVPPAFKLVALTVDY